MHTASACCRRSGFLCHFSSSTPPTVCAFHPPTLSLSLSLSLSPSVSPSVSTSPTHLMLPPTHLPSFYPISSANTLPCRVGHVMKKWLVRALHRASYFIISRAFLPLHSWSATVSLSLSLSLTLPLSSFSSSVSLAPLFLLQPHARGRLKLCEGGEKKGKKKKVCCYFYSQGLPTARPSIDEAFFSPTTSWILTLCLQLAAQQLCKTWQQVAFRGFSHIWCI